MNFTVKSATWESLGKVIEKNDNYAENNDKMDDNIMLEGEKLVQLANSFANLNKPRL